MMTVADETRRAREGSEGWLIQRLARRLDDAMNARLAAHGLNIQQFAVLMTVLEHDGLTQTEIGDRFGMPAYAISRALDTLADAGLVERHAYPGSRRAFSISGTNAAVRLAPALRAIVAEVNDSLCAPLSATDRKAFKAVLERLHAAGGPSL